MGRITGLYGVRGWVKVYSFTQPLENILGYQPWLLESANGVRTVRLAEGRTHGKGLVARVEGVEDRDAAAALVGVTVRVAKTELPRLGRNEFYYADLEGLDVVTVDGVSLGQVSHLFETGANAVMVVKGERERLLPFLFDRVVRDVDVESRRITVDWDPEF